MRCGILHRHIHRRSSSHVGCEAPLAIAKDTPAIPNAGAALFRPFRFELFFARAILVPSHI
jgi:hypothetical protein